MALEHYKTQILLLHSEQSTLHELSTGFNDQYSVHLATSGTEALNIFSETPVHVIVSAKDLPGMSGLDALREAKKRSPDTIGILLADNDSDDGLEALVDDRDIFQIIRGPIKPEALRTLIDAATKQARLVELSKSANDTTADLDMPMSETIVMETAENGSAIISGGTGQVRALQPQKISIDADAGRRSTDVLVLTKDEAFLATIRDSSRGLHHVHHAVTPKQAEEAVKNHEIGVLVTDAAMVGPNIENLTQRLRQNRPRIVAIVAGRRDDGELLMDLINRGHVYRFLLKPVSPGRARLAIEASINHHLDAPEKAFKTAPKTAQESPAKPVAKAQPVSNNTRTAKVQPVTKALPAAKAKPNGKAPAPMKVSRADPLTNDNLDNAFPDGGGFAEAMKGIASTVNNKLSSITKPESNKLTSAHMSALLGKTKFLSIAAGIIIAVAGIAWFLLQPDDAPPAKLVGNPDVKTAPSIIESDIVPNQADKSAAIEAIIPSAALVAARAARDDGQLVGPPAENAIELYMSVLVASPGDPVATLELAAVIEQVFGMTESAILEQRLGDATIALQMLQLSNPDNPRLPFLDAQLSQLKFRRTLDSARMAIREGRFEDADGWVNSALSLAGADSVKVQAIASELSAARNAQQVNEVLALAASRLEINRLIQPSNDNARYYYELALNNDPQNTAARQGLGIVASKLVLQAGIAIDGGQFASAETLLGHAHALDPASKQLAESAAALESAIKARAQAETDAKIAAEQAQAKRIAEQKRLADEAQVAEQETNTVTTADTSAKTAAPGTPESRAIDDNQIPASLAVAATALTPPTIGEEYAEPNSEISASGENSAVEPALPVTEQASEPDTVAVSTLSRINYVAPSYPRSARRRNVTGSVDVAFTVQKNGLVTDVVVLESAPGTIFDQAATDAVTQWRFEPTVENGRQVAKKTAVRLSFDLQ